MWIFLLLSNGYWIFTSQLAIANIILRHYKKRLESSQIYHGYEHLATDTHYPNFKIWQKRRKKKQVCGAACFIAAKIKLSQDVRLFGNIWLSTRVTACRINFNFTDIIHLVRSIHDTGNGSCSSLNMHILTQLLIFAFWSFLRPFFKVEPSNLIQLEH